MNFLYRFGVGGGIKTIEDISKLFHSGADKVVINTYAVQENSEIINQAAQIFWKSSCCSKYRS